MAQSNATQSFTCALTGLTPLADPVVTPSGYVCSRRLLLTKLAENGGVDPFDASGVRRLDEAAFVALSTSTESAVAGVVPPRPPTATSLPSLLYLLQSEFDAILLELHDTRTALEEARRELSSALYQNDAAVRVLARLVAERDAARDKIAGFVAEGVAASVVEEPPAKDAPAKRGRAGEDARAPAKKAKVVAADDASHDSAAAPKEGKENENGDEDRTTIPPAILAAMCATWKSLSGGRRTLARKKRTLEETAASEKALALLAPEAKGAPSGRNVNLGKTSAKNGVLCLGGGLTSGDDAYVVAGGHHRSAVVYDVAAGTVVATLEGAQKKVDAVHGMAFPADGVLRVVTGSTDGLVRLYAVPVGKDGPEPTLLGSAAVPEDATGAPRPIAVTVHPATTPQEALIVVASSAGSVGLYQWSADGAGEALALRTLLEGDRETRYAAGCLHPDGLIYVAGTDDGRLVIWDLKTQAIAGTLKGHDGHTIHSLAISENGYHVATAAAAGPIHIWDLRKLKLSAIVDPGDDVGTVAALAFDPTATYLAYAGGEAAKVCVAKDWDQVVCTLSWSRGRGKKREDRALVGGVTWGAGGGAKDGVWLAAGCDGQRPIRFWGIEK